MGKKSLVLLYGILVLAIVANLMTNTVSAEQEITVKGTVNEIGQLIDDNDAVYEIADTQMGIEVMELLGQEVSVTGTVMDADGTKIITVTGYEIVE
jgi:hypothetical protein